MSEQKPPEGGYTPASFEKRTAAWTGLAYVLMFLFVSTYSIFTARNLPGTLPLLAVPVAAAGLVLSLRSVRLGRGTAHLLMSLLCGLMLALSLWLGVPPLLAALRAPLG